MKILVAAPHPGIFNETEGMMQRVAEMDNFLRASFPNVEVDYIQITYRKKSSHTVDVNTGSSLYVLNAFIDALRIESLITNYSIVYVHSLYNYRGLWPFLRNSKHLVIADLHGVVPDEERFSGHYMSSLGFSALESSLLKRAQIVVTVTRSMTEHFQGKYGHILKGGKRLVLLPIFDEKLHSVATLTPAFDKMEIAIYAGGLQPWQNVPLVAQAIPKLAQEGFITECYFSAYRKTEQEEHVVREIERVGGRVGSLSRKELFRRYEQASLGFLLRDDITVNRVSSPTKLNEYLAFGIVPILLQPKVGDFATLGYHYLRFDDLMTANMPGWEQIGDMARENLERYQVQLQQGAQGKAQLKRMIEELQ